MQIRKYTLMRMMGPMVVWHQVVASLAAFEVYILC